MSSMNSHLTSRTKTPVKSRSPGYRIKDVDHKRILKEQKGLAMETRYSGQTINPIFQQNIHQNYGHALYSPVGNRHHGLGPISPYKRVTQMMQIEQRISSPPRGKKSPKRSGGSPKRGESPRKSTSPKRDTSPKYNRKVSDVNSR